MYADINKDALGNKEETVDVLNEVGIVDDNEGGITDGGKLDGNEEVTGDSN